MLHAVVFGIVVCHEWRASLTTKRVVSCFSVQSELNRYRFWYSLLLFFRSCSSELVVNHSQAHMFFLCLMCYVDSIKV